MCESGRNRHRSSIPAAFTNDVVRISNGHDYEKPRPAGVLVLKYLMIISIKIVAHSTRSTSKEIDFKVATCDNAVSLMTAW